MQDDLKKFYGKGNKAAGTRARKGLQKLKKLAQEIRMEIQDIKNNEM
ncbi:MAG: histone H1 [Bacteroidetes bacterium QS_8_68_28]|nr:MAG: histone H1 [Bacteroidetes bacterium QS_8_68_28]